VATGLVAGQSSSRRDVPVGAEDEISHESFGAMWLSLRHRHKPAGRGRSSSWKSSHPLHARGTQAGIWALWWLTKVWRLQLLDGQSNERHAVRRHLQHTAEIYPVLLLDTEGWASTVLNAVGSSPAMLQIVAFPAGFTPAVRR